MSNKNNKIEDNIEVTRSLVGFPYFVLRNEIKTGYNLYTSELLEIKQNYINYNKGTKFYPEGSAGSYVPSDIRFKIAKRLIDKEARFMFSQSPDVNIHAVNTRETEKEQARQYQNLVSKVLEKSNFARSLLQGAKDCFIGKRIAGLVDFSEEDGIQIHFYDSLQFYYETEYGSDRLTKFISFENVNQTKTTSEKLFLVNRYEERNGTIYMSSILYNGRGVVVETLISETQIELDYIPAVVITNDGTLEDKRGVSEMESLADSESGYSRLSNADIDSDRKGMNPKTYVVDMNSETTKNLPSGPGAFWELKSEQNQNDVYPMVGQIAPELNHTESVKTTLDRIENSMYSEVDVPNITAETMVGTITSGKALTILYYPLKVRCDEKLKVWKPAIKFLIETVIDFAKLNKSMVQSMYVLEGLEDVQLNVVIEENYALLEDEQEEKDSDLSEIAQNTRSRKSYIKKWRKEEFQSDEQIEEELLQIAKENNMFDSLSINAQVQDELNKEEAQKQIDENIKDIEVDETNRNNPTPNNNE